MARLRDLDICISSSPSTLTILLLDVQQRRACVWYGRRGRNLRESRQNVHRRNQCRKGVEKWNVRKGHFDDILDHFLLRLHVLLLVLLVLRRRRAQIPSVKNTPDYHSLPSMVK